MRLFVVALLATIPAAASAVDLRNAPQTMGALPRASADCPRTASYYAYHEGKPLKPRKLTELPPAIGYMAVYRTINGCDAPLTMVEYRSSRRQ